MSISDNKQSAAKAAARCRFCGTPLRYTFVDLGMQPPCNSMIRPDQLNAMEAHYPLHAYVCEQCYLVQLQEYVTPHEIFSDYSYFSSYSDSYLQHARHYAEVMSVQLGLNDKSQVIEIASNDGYLLQNFVRMGIPALGVEPAANVAQVAMEKGIPTLIKFFGQQTAHELVAHGFQADLLIGNHVLAHVPDINDFVAGMKIVLAPRGQITMEFPHLMRLINENEFDTIYHEHFSYLSVITVGRIFAAHGLTLFDVEEIHTHGGSLRIYACHAEDTSKAVSKRVGDLRERELSAGLTNLETYLSFGEQAKATKRKLLTFLINAKQAGKTIVGYGAPGKGNTLLNYCGIRSDFIDFTVDRSPYKQGNYLPGTHIPVYEPEKIREAKPDYVLILPWNFKEEIMQQMAYIGEWGGQFVVPIPEVKVLAQV